MESILDVKNLKAYYYSKKKTIPAVDGVSFLLKRGEVLGIVGESGCGKSTVVKAMLGLLDKSYARIVDGEVLYKNHDLLRMTGKALREIRGKQISMIFQNAFSALNPVFTIGNQIIEILTIHERLGYKAARERAIELLHLVRMPSPEIRFNSYPHQFSGGMLQRVLIAIAIACGPRILIADEPTTALDVTIQAQILDLIRELQSSLQMGIIIITHNMGVVAEMCDNMMIMYGGVVVESGKCTDVFADPVHPYSYGLLASIPSTTEDKEFLYSIAGQVPEFIHPVCHCRFAGRCEHTFERCRQSEPPLFQMSEDRFVRCWLVEKDAC